jgi:hypothetical protein
MRCGRARIPDRSTRTACSQSAAEPFQPEPRNRSKVRGVRGGRSPSRHGTTVGAKRSLTGGQPMPALDYRPSYSAALIAALAVFALYVLTLGSSTAMWDTSEYITAAYVVGLPHPPGFRPVGPRLRSPADRP